MYKILWIEDQMHSIRGKKRVISNYIENEKGFELEIKYIETFQQFKDEIGFDSLKNYDLLLIDLNLDDDEMEMNLQLVNIAFQDANKWRFSDGNATFYADVLDSDFLNKVQFSEISFSKGDILKAKVRRVQYLRNNDMKTEYQIIKIIDHKKGLSQLSMPFVD